MDKYRYNHDLFVFSFFFLFCSVDNYLEPPSQICKFSKVDSLPLHWMYAYSIDLLVRQCTCSKPTSFQHSTSHLLIMNWSYFEKLRPLVSIATIGEEEEEEMVEEEPVHPLRGLIASPPCPRRPFRSKTTTRFHWSFLLLLLYFLDVWSVMCYNYKLFNGVDQFVGTEHVSEPDKRLLVSGFAGNAISIIYLI